MFFKSNYESVEAIYKLPNTTNSLNLICMYFVLHSVFLISLRLDFRRYFLLCNSSLISSQGLSKVFWKFKFWPPVHSDAYFGMDGLCQSKCTCSQVCRGERILGHTLNQDYTTASIQSRCCPLWLLFEPSHQRTPQG